MGKIAAGLTVIVVVCAACATRTRASSRPTPLPALGDVRKMGDSLVTLNEQAERELEKRLATAPKVSRTVNNVNTLVGVIGGVITAVISSDRVGKYTGAGTSFAAGVLAFISNQNQPSGNDASCSNQYVRGVGAWRVAETGNPNVDDYRALQDAILRIHETCPQFRVIE